MLLLSILNVNNYCLFIKLTYGKLDLSNLLRKLILKADKAALEKAEIIELIQQGVSNRLSENLTGALQRYCAEVLRLENSD